MMILRRGWRQLHRCALPRCATGSRPARGFVTTSREPVATGAATDDSNSTTPAAAAAAAADTAAAAQPMAAASAVASAAFPHASTLLQTRRPTAGAAKYRRFKAERARGDATKGDAKSDANADTEIEREQLFGEPHTDAVTRRHETACALHELLQKQSLRAALSYFRKLKRSEQSVVHWNLILTELGRQQQLSDALQHFEKLKALTQPPIVLRPRSGTDSALVVPRAVLTRGRERSSLSDEEKERFRFQPNVHTFAALVHAIGKSAAAQQQQALQPDLPLSRAGRLLARMGGATVAAPDPRPASPAAQAAASVSAAVTSAAAQTNSRFELVWSLYRCMVDAYGLADADGVVLTSLMHTATVIAAPDLRAAAMNRVWAEIDALASVAVTRTQRREAGVPLETPDPVVLAGPPSARPSITPLQAAALAADAAAVEAVAAAADPSRPAPMEHARGACHVAMVQCADRGARDEFDRVAERMRAYGLRPTVQTYGVLMRAFAKFGDAKSLIATLETMRKRRVKPNHIIWNTLLTFFASKGDMSRVDWVCSEMQAHGVQPDAVTNHAILNAFAKAGDLQKCVDHFEQLKRTRPHSVSVVTYNVVLGAFASTRGADLALAHKYWEELRARFQPTIVSANAVLKLMSGTPGSGERALQFFNEIVRSGLHPTDQTRTLLLSAFSRSGDADGMAQALDAWNKRLGGNYLPPTSYTLNSLLSGLLGRSAAAAASADADDADADAAASASGDAAVATAAVSAERLDLAREYLVRWQAVIDSTTCNVLIDHYARTHDRAGLFATLYRLLQYGFVPLSPTVATLVRIAAEPAHDAPRPSSVPTFVGASGAGGGAGAAVSERAAVHSPERSADTVYSLASDVGRWDAVRLWRVLMHWTLTRRGQVTTVSARVFLQRWPDRELSYGVRRRREKAVSATNGCSRRFLSPVAAAQIEQFLVALCEEYPAALAATAPSPATESRPPPFSALADGLGVSSAALHACLLPAPPAAAKPASSPVATTAAGTAAVSA